MEARRSYRLDLSTELILTQGQHNLHGQVINVGLTGIMGSTSVALEKGSQYLIQFTLRPERSIFKSWANVAWSQEHDEFSYLVGLQFERTDSEMHRVLADYISGRWINEHLSPGSYGSYQ